MSLTWIALVITRSFDILPWSVQSSPGCVCSKSTSLTSNTQVPTANCSDNIDAVWNISRQTEAIYFSGFRLPNNDVIDLRDIVDNLEELTITWCHVTSLSDIFNIGARPRRALKVDHNDLTQLHNRTFYKVSSLQYLSLSNNKLESIDVDAFCGLQQLQVLDLSGNKLFNSESRWLCHLIKLVSLNLRDNDLTVLHKSSFQNALNLQTLDIGANRIRHIDDFSLLGLSNLIQLYLDDNDLLEVPSGALSHLTIIEELDLSRNNLKNINRFNASKLRLLKLNKMKRLQIVDKYSFVELFSLRRLEMFGNGLRYIDREAFVELPALETLVLHNNNLDTLDQQVIHSLPSLRSLDIHSNPFTCDCTSQWIYKLYNSNNNKSVTIVNADRLQCNASYNLTSMKFYESQNMCCGPRVVKLFNSSDLKTSVTDSLDLYCRAAGVPPPRTNWILPKGTLNKHVNNIICYSLIMQFIQTFKIIIDFVKYHTKGDHK